MEPVAVEKRQRRRGANLWNLIKSSPTIQCYLLLALPIIGFLLFKVYPIIWSAQKAWFYYDLMPKNTRFVGLDNFFSIFTKDFAYWKTWLTTFKYAFWKLLFEIPTALFFASMLSRNYKGAGFYRSMYYLPNIISVAIVGVIFSNLFDYYGAINRILQSVGLIKSPLDWFANQNSALFVLIAGGIWQGFGINTLYFCAAINNVPKELYEAAEIDGAGTVRKFVSITFPRIAPIFGTVLLLAINGTIQVGEYVIVMTNGAPAGSTYTVGAYMIGKFVPGFASTLQVVNVGYGCAMALISSVMYALIAVLYIKGTKKLKQIDG